MEPSVKEKQATLPRVGVLTFHFVRNFGGMLQAYALLSFLKDLGFDAKIIDYRPSHVECGGRFRIPSSRNAIRSNLINVYQFQRQLRSRWFRDQAQDDAFGHFLNNDLAPKTTLVTNPDRLNEATANLDFLICGSDQIWNPSGQNGIDSAYFLDFASPAVKCCSYAASFGRPTVPERFKPEIARLLERLATISVREQSGAEIIKELTGREAVVLPDPTLLLSDYSNVSDDSLVPDKPYVLTYSLRSSAGICKAAEQVAKRLGAVVVDVKASRLSPGRSRETLYPGPKQWLSLFQNASFVITNSFHGTAFSIINQKPFYTLSIGGKKARLDERSKNLLSTFNLLDRFLISDNDQVPLEQPSTEIDWRSVDMCRAKLVENASEYIRSFATQNQKIASPKQKSQT